jgi:2-desacetyl-2-hydroxyethyl bacteriochlorophyllide A dehydrogenase
VGRLKIKEDFSMINSMTAFMKVQPEPGGVVFQNWNIPDIGPEDVLIQVQAAGLCGTDLHVYDWPENIVREYKPKLPLVMGHEFAGVIVQAGPQVKNVKVGDRVTAMPVLYCEDCYFCRDGKENICDNRPILGIGTQGAFAQYISIRSRNVYRLDEQVSFELGAMSELACVGLHALDRARLTGGDVVAVVGAGPLGLMMTIMAKHFGATRVFTTGLEADRGRLEIARKIGAIPIIVDREDPKKRILELTSGLGADVVFETAGTGAGVAQCLNIARKGGRIGILGQGHEAAEIQTATLSFREIELIGTRAYTPKDWSRVSATLLKTAGDLSQMITHRLPLSRTEEGIRLMKSREGLKIILFPQEP